MANPVKEKIINGIFLSLFGTAIGFGVSQATLATEVKVSSAKIISLDRTDTEIKAILDTQREVSNAHMAEVVTMMRDYFKMNQEFINLIKVQNELLIKDHNQR